MRGILLPFLIGLAVPACDGKTSCAHDQDCPKSEACLYVGSDLEPSCVEPCQGESDCPISQSCTGAAHSCPTCDDYIQICE